MYRIAVGCDHAGFVLKQRLADVLRDLGHEVSDLGAHSADRVDYPDFGEAVGRAVADGDADYGVCVCGSGLGIAMAANKVPGVRAAPVPDVLSAQLARQHNDANVLCLGARVIDATVLTETALAFLGTDFAGGRHARRVAKLDALDAPD